MTTATSAAPVVAVLAGGRGERLGGRKPSVALAGRPLISYPLQTARDAGLEAIVVAKPDSVLPPLQERVVHDHELTRHPLSGVLAALGYADSVIVLACDMPFVPAAMLRWMADQEAQTVVTRPGGFVQPFPALYRARAAHSLHSSLKSEHSMKDSIARLRPRVLDESELLAFGADVQMFFSVNTPGDLLMAEDWLQRRSHAGPEPTG